MSISQQAPLSPESVDVATTPGRFLNGSRLAIPTDPLQHARWFYTWHADILPGDGGIVLQAGIQEEDPNARATGYTPLEKLTDYVLGHSLVGPSEPRNNTVSLLFDAQKSNEEIYGWEVNIASSGKGRQLLQLHVGRAGLTALRRVRDHQGAIVKTNPVEAAPVYAIVHKLSTNPFIGEAATKLRSTQNNMQGRLAEMISKHIVEKQKIRTESRTVPKSPQLIEYLHEKMDKKETELRKQLDTVGFRPAHLEKLSSN